MKKFKKAFNTLRQVLKNPGMTVLPGQLAFFFVLSLVPMLTLIIYFTSLFSLTLTDISDYFNINFSPEIIELITPIVEIEGINIGLIIVIIIGIYLSSNGMSSVIVTANNIYGIKQPPFLTRKIKSTIMVLIVMLLFLFMLLVPLLGNFILDVIQKITGYNEIYGVLNILKTPFSWFIIFLFIKILYTIAPDKKIPSAFVNTGAIFTSLGWIIATSIYLYYVGHFANYNLFYSGLSNIAILMIWIYILAYIFVIGIGINYVEEPNLIERIEKLEAEKSAKKNQNKKEK